MPAWLLIYWVFMMPIFVKGIFDRKGLDPDLFGAYDRKGSGADKPKNEDK